VEDKTTDISVYYYGMFLRRSHKIRDFGVGALFRVGTDLSNSMLHMYQHELLLPQVP